MRNYKQQDYNPARNCFERAKDISIENGDDIMIKICNFFIKDCESKLEVIINE